MPSVETICLFLSSYAGFNDHLLPYYIVFVCICNRREGVISSGGNANCDWKQKFKSSNGAFIAALKEMGRWGTIVKQTPKPPMNNINEIYMIEWECAKILFKSVEILYVADV